MPSVVSQDIHSCLFVLDLDRCLITDRAYSVLDEVIERAAGLDSIPSAIVDHKRKSQYINEWWSDIDGYFTVPLNNDTLRTESIVLVDDKAGAFDELPEEPHARGYWLKAAELLS